MDFVKRGIDLTILISLLKIIFLLGFLIMIHEAGHLLVAKMCKVKVNEYSIGFGPAIWKKQGKETLYSIRIIPLGGYCNMEGEEEKSEKEGSFSEASIPKRIAIVLAGATVNIIFGFIVFFILSATAKTEIVDYYLASNLKTDNSFINHIRFGGMRTKELAISVLESIKMLFTGKLGVNDMTGIVGISDTVAKTSNMREFLSMLSLISVSLGITNLLPIPALDGGKIVLLIIEAIRRKPLNQQTEINIQLIGFSLLIALSIFVTYNDIVRILQ